MKQVIIHLGLHKTATKFLQVDFFPKLPDFNYIPKHLYERELLDSLMHTDYLAFQQQLDDTRGYIASFVKDPEKPVILSNELFSGNPFFRNSTRYIILKKLKDLYPDAKLILSLRGQRGMIDSLYREYILQGGVKPISEFISGKLPRNKSILATDPCLDLETLKYGPYLDAISDLFGRDHLHVVPYEMMMSDFDGFITGIADFLGITIDPKQFSSERRHSSLDNSYLKLLRLTNKMHKSAFHHAGLFHHKFNIGHVLRKMKLTKLDRGKSSMFDCQIPVNYQDDNSYIDKAFNLNLKEKFENYYFS